MFSADFSHRYNIPTASPRNRAIQIDCDFAIVVCNCFKVANRNVNSIQRFDWYKNYFINYNSCHFHRHCRHRTSRSFFPAANLNWIISPRLLFLLLFHAIQQSIGHKPNRFKLPFATPCYRSSSTPVRQTRPSPPWHSRVMSTNQPTVINLMSSNSILWNSIN